VKQPIGREETTFSANLSSDAPGEYFAFGGDAAHGNHHKTTGASPPKTTKEKPRPISIDQVSIKSYSTIYEVCNPWIGPGSTRVLDPGGLPLLEQAVGKVHVRGAKKSCKGSGGSGKKMTPLSFLQTQNIDRVVTIVCALSVKT